MQIATSEPDIGLLEAPFSHTDCIAIESKWTKNGMSSTNDVHCCRYRDAPEPHLPGHSVTVRPTAQDMKKLYDDAEQTWTPAFVKLIKVECLAALKSAVALCYPQSVTPCNACVLVNA